MNVTVPVRVLIVLTVCLQGVAALATVGVWTNAADGVWSVGANWQEGEAVVSNGAAFFRAANGVIAVSNDLTTVSLTGLTFNDGTDNDASWTLNGSALALVAPAIVDVQANTSTLALAVNSATNVVKAGGGALRFSGGNKSSVGTTVNAGALLIGEASEPGSGVLRLTGSSIRFLADGTPGLLESCSPNNNITLSTMGTNIGVRLTTRMANTNSNLSTTYPGNTQYIYLGR